MLEESHFSNLMFLIESVEVMCCQEQNRNRNHIVFHCYCAVIYFLLLLKDSCIVKVFLGGMESLKAWLIGFLCCNRISRLAGVVYEWIELLDMCGARLH